MSLPQGWFCTLFEVLRSLDTVLVIAIATCICSVTSTAEMPTLYRDGEGMELSYHLELKLAGCNGEVARLQRVHCVVRDIH